MNRKTCRLEDLAAKGRSIISGPFGSSIGSRFFQSDGVPVIRGNNLTTDHKKFVEEGFAFVSHDKAEELNAYALRDDILFTAAGTIGQVGIIPRNSRFEKYVISNKQLRIRIDPEKADPDFVFYWLASPWIFETIQNRNTGSTVPLINLGTIRGLPVVLPGDVEAQKKVSALLGSIDAKIELNQRINAELEGMAKLLYDYWFVQFDFPMTAAQAAALGKPKLAGHPYRTSGGKMIYNETLKREIPEGWTDGTLEDVLTLQYGKALKKDIQVPGDYPVYGSGGIYGSHNVPLVQGPGIIVGRKGSVGELHWSNISFYPTDTSYYVEPKVGIDLNYVYFLLQRLPLKSMNSDSAVPGLSRIAAYQLPATLPDKALIAEFGKFAALLRATIANNEQQTQELTQLRDWLLPMLMNGQVTVG